MQHSQPGPDQRGRRNRSPSAGLRINGATYQRGTRARSPPGPNRLEHRAPMPAPTRQSQTPATRNGKRTACSRNVRASRRVIDDDGMNADGGTRPPTKGSGTFEGAPPFGVPLSGARYLRTHCARDCPHAVARVARNDGRTPGRKSPAPWRELAAVGVRTMVARRA